MSNSKFEKLSKICETAISDKAIFDDIKKCNDEGITPTETFLKHCHKLLSEQRDFFKEDACCNLTADISRKIGAFWSKVFKKKLGYSRSDRTPKVEGIFSLGIRNATIYFNGEKAPKRRKEKRDEDAECKEREKLTAPQRQKKYHEYDDEAAYLEGKAIQRTTRSYERNRNAREVCLNECGYRCSVCDFCFEELYGEIGEGFIHVHHIYDISEKGEEYEVNPQKDLCPVCPNCHAMLHRQKPAIKVEELKKIIQRKRESVKQ